jgi:long-chain acyl-CoA synthetase
MGENLLTKLDTMTPTDEFVSFLPLPWVGEQMTCISGALLVGFTVNFPEEPTTAREDTREIAPHIMFSPPSIWEGMLSSIQVKIEDASWLKKRLYHLLMPYGQQMADARFTGDEPDRWDHLRYRLAQALMFRALKDRLGLARIRTAYSGGAALGPDVFKFFHALGINLKQIYGQTEISGISVVHRDDDIKFDTVGLPIEETDIKIAENGEILSRSPSVFLGYYKNPEATAETLIDGWLHSGDAGSLDEDGHLVVIDRLKDVMHLTDGTMFSPQFIENKLKFSQYIHEAVVFGDGREHVTAFINIEYQNVARWAERQHIAFTTYTDLSQKPEVYDWIRQRVQVVNTQLPALARIRRFVILHKELDADDQELTRTKKVRRGFIEKKYLDLVEALYGTTDRISVEANVRYRDGRKEVIQTFVHIEMMEAE